MLCVFSALYVRGLPQRYKETGEKYQVCLYIFYSGRTLCSRFTAKIANRSKIYKYRFSVPYDLIVVQPFTATADPSVLGIKPIPNIQEKIQKMIAKYRAETIDIEDVEYEEADLEEDVLFNDEIENAKRQL